MHPAWRPGTLLALTRPVSPAISACELTHLERTPIDPVRAALQHARYESALAAAGCTVRPLPALDDAPDGVFVEDVAVVVPGLAVMTRPGAVSRRGEGASVQPVLASMMPVVALTAPATLDGGDVLRFGTTLYVGRSPRTNDEGIRQLAAAVESAGITVLPVEFRGALHLKTAAGALDDETVLLNPDWVDADQFDGLRAVRIDPGEPFAANVLRVLDHLVVPEAHPRTAELCAPYVPQISPVPADELARAEGGVTCCSILVEGLGDA